MPIGARHRTIVYIWSFNFGFTINTIKKTLSQKTSVLKTL